MYSTANGGKKKPRANRKDEEPASFNCRGHEQVVGKWSFWDSFSDKQKENRQIAYRTCVAQRRHAGQKDMVYAKYSNRKKK